MVNSAVNPQDLEQFQAAQQAVQERQRQKLQREQQLKKLAQEQGLDEDQALLIFAEMERQQKLKQQSYRREQLAQQQQAEQVRIKRLREANQEQATIDRRNQQAAKRFQATAFKTMGLPTSNSGEVIEDWFALAVWWSIFLVSAVIIGPLGGMWAAIDGAWDSFCGSRVGGMVGCSADKPTDVESPQESGIAFEPLEIATPFFIDDSPPGSYDFTLLRNGSDAVQVPSPCNGKITESGMRGGYGNAIAVLCDDGTDLFMAHFASLDLKAGDAVVKGQSLGIQGSTGNSTGPHIHLEVTLPGKATTDRSVTRPYVENVLFPFWKSGQKGSSGSGASSKAVDLIASFEGFHPTPYWDYSQWTWGYGTKAPSSSGTITREEAHQEKIAYLENACQPAIAPLDVNENQAAALYSLCYNLGTVQFTESDVYRAVKAGDMQGAADAFGLYVHADGVRLAGLVRRRQQEKELFLPD